MVNNGKTEIEYKRIVWKYISGEIKSLPFKGIVVSCYSHMAAFLARYHKGIPNKSLKRPMTKLRLFFFRGMKRSLSSKELEIHIQELYFILNCKEFDKDKFHSEDITSEDTTLYDINNIRNQIKEFDEIEMEKDLGVKWRTNFSKYNAQKEAEEIEKDEAKDEAKDEDEDEDEIDDSELDEDINRNEQNTMNDILKQIFSNRELKVMEINDYVIFRPKPEGHPHIGIMINVTNNTAYTLCTGYKILIEQNKKNEKDNIWENKFYSTTQWEYLKIWMIQLLPYYSDMMVGGAFHQTNQEIENLFRNIKVKL